MGGWVQQGAAAYGEQGLNIRVRKSGRIKLANLADPQLKTIGDAMVAEQKKRWEDGINAEGNQAKPLSKRYFFIKRAFLHQTAPIRDMRMTGATVANFTLRKAVQGVIRAENTSRETRRRAQRAQKAEEMIGFAGSDQILVFREAQKQYGTWLKKAWVPIG